MSEAGFNSYDEVPYQGGPFRRSQPRHLATLATLLGMSPPDVECCRVLELGCAEGGNLIPAAALHPRSRFLGIDFSQRQIAAGSEMIGRLGLGNVRLAHGDILDFDASCGQFDYIIAHGVYSWVPEEVREKVLAVCRENLAPDGVAYVSYNTYPGGHLRTMVREMLLYHAALRHEPDNSVEHARLFLDFLLEAVPPEHAAYRAVLEWEQGHIRPFPDHQVRHDSLSETNHACYFSQFVERARAHGLQYLAEANFSTMLPRNFPPAVREVLTRLSRNVVEIEQYMDFLRNRAFRETLLCHANVAIDRAVSAERITGLFIGSSLAPENEAPDPTADVEERFRDAGGAEVAVQHPLSRTMLRRLAALWPRNERFSDLVAHAAEQSGANSPDPRDVQLAAETLLQCFAAGLIEFDVLPSTCADASVDRPAVSALNRLQAQAGSIVTNQRHESVRLDPCQRALVPHLDGRLTRAQLLEKVSGLLADGTLSKALSSGAAAGTAPVPRAKLAERLDLAINQLAGAAILVDPQSPQQGARPARGPNDADPFLSSDP